MESDPEPVGYLKRNYNFNYTHEQNSPGYIHPGNYLPCLPRCNNLTFCIRTWISRRLVFTYTYRTPRSCPYRSGFFNTYILFSHSLLIRLCNQSVAVPTIPSTDAFSTPQQTYSPFQTVNVSPTVVFHRATAFVKLLPERWRTPTIVSISNIVLLILLSYFMLSFVLRYNSPWKLVVIFQVISWTLLSMLWIMRLRRTHRPPRLMMLQQLCSKQRQQEYWDCLTS